MRAIGLTIVELFNCAVCVSARQVDGEEGEDDDDGGEGTEAGEMN